MLTIYSSCSSPPCAWSQPDFFKLLGYSVYNITNFPWCWLKCWQENGHKAALYLTLQLEVSDNYHIKTRFLILIVNCGIQLTLLSALCFSVECFNDNQKPVNQAGHVWRILMCHKVQCWLFTRQSTSLPYSIGLQSSYIKSAISLDSSVIRKWNMFG